MSCHIYLNCFYKLISLSFFFVDDPNVNPDDIVEPYTISDNGYELVLPSGTVIGHRSLLRYYKYVFCKYFYLLFH